MVRIVLSAIVACMFVIAGCQSGDSAKSADAKTPAAAAPASWHDAVAGTYTGVVGGNSDPIVFEFAHADGKLAATYTIDDPAFDTKPYKGKLTAFTPTPGKDRTLSCRYEDAMNAGSYELTFTKDLKKMTGTYVIDGEAEDPDTNTVTATKK